MDSGRVHLVAPDDELRRSVTFALAAYGYSVTADLLWPADGHEPFDCMLVDERVLKGKGLGAMRKDRRPVLLLAYKPALWDHLEVDGVIAMPLTGEAVIQAVEAAVTATARGAK